MTGGAGEPRWERLLGATQSPIEAALLNAFCEAAVANGYGVARRPRDGVIGVVPQEQVGPYFLDIGVHFRLPCGVALDLAVEADGYKFHHRTARQSGYEKRREAIIAAHGFRVLRFTGSEIHMSAGRCAAEIMRNIMDFQTEKIVGSARR